MAEDSEVSSELSVAKKLGFASITVLVALGALEGLARLLVDARDARIHREHENMITVLGLPSLNATMEFDPELFWKLRNGLEEQRVEGAIRGAPISFRVSTTDSLRSPAIRSARPELRVLALGDSCTFGLGVDDDATWPAQLELQLREQGLDAEVINAGVPGYTAFQGLRWFEERGLALEPDVIVVAFGFNDRDSWSSRSDADTARLLELPRWETVASHSRMYTGLRRLLRSSGGETPLAADDAEANAAIRVPRLAPAEFVDVLRTIALRAQEAGTEVVFANWPFRPQVDEGVRQALFYQILVEEVARETGARMVNLMDPFIDDGGDLFVDHIHASADGNRVAAEALLPAILAD